MFCTNCGKEMANEAMFCGHCGTQQAGTIKASPIPVNNPPAVYAGFWKRVGAYLADIVIVIIGSIPISILIGLLIESSHIVTKPTAALIQFLLGIPLLWIYFSVMEGTGRSATFGKRLLGLKVARLDGTPLSKSMSTSIWRNFAKLLIVPLTFHVGFIISLFTPRKQALHDILAGTLVVNADATQEDIAAAKPHNSSMTNKVAAALSLIGGVVIVVLIGMSVWVMDKPSPSRVAATPTPASGESTSTHSPPPAATKQQDPMQWTQIGSSIIDKDITAQDYIDYSRIFQTAEGYFSVWVLSDFNKIQPHLPDEVDALPQHASRLIAIGIDCTNARAAISANMLCAMSMGKGKCVEQRPVGTPTVKGNIAKDIIPLPDGSAVKVRSGETKMQAWERAQWMYPEAFKSSLDEYIRRRNGMPINLEKFAPIASGSFERKIADAVCSR